MTKTSRDLAKKIIALGMTQTEIAERVGSTQATVSKLIRGGISDISYATGKRMEALYEERARRTKQNINAPSQPHSQTPHESNSTPAD